jgi:hypothetical protein
MTLMFEHCDRAGILCGFEGSKARRALINNEAALATHLNNGATAGPGVGGF